jgi:hypothetical protein
MESIEKYREAVENLAHIQSPVCFRNSNPHHAAIVMSTIINTSEKEIRIFDNDLKGDLTDIYPELGNSIESYVKNGKSLKIVLEKITTTNSNIYKRLKKLSESYSHNVHIKIASPEFVESLKKELKGSYYFMVGDNRAVRIQLTYDKRKAYCCFANYKIASRFINVFDLHFNDCDSIFFE